MSLQTCNLNTKSGLLSPFLFYFSPLLITLGLYYLGYSTLFTSGFNLETGISLLMIFGIPLCLLFSRSRKINNACQIDCSLTRIIPLMTALSTMAYVIQIAILGLPPMFKSRNKTEYFVFGVSLFFYLSQFVAPMAYSWWRISGKNVYLFYFSWNFFMLATMMNKNPVMQTLCTSFILHMLFSKKSANYIWLKIIGFSCFLILVVYLMFSLNPVFRDYEGYFYLLQKEQGVQGISDPILSLIYMYAASGWENFFFYMTRVVDYSYGSMFFQPIVKLVKIDAIFPDVIYPDLITATLKSPRLTTATGYFRMFSDFGFVSLFLYISIYFGFVHYLYRSVAKRCTYSGVYFLTYSNIFLAFLFFDNYFFLTISAFGLISAFVAFKISRFRLVWRSR